MSYIFDFYLFFMKKITPNYTAKMINIEASKVMVEVKTLSNIARDVIDIVVGQTDVELPK